MNQKNIKHIILTFIVLLISIKNIQIGDYCTGMSEDLLF